MILRRDSRHACRYAEQRHVVPRRATLRLVYSLGRRQTGVESVKSQPCLLVPQHIFARSVVARPGQLATWTDRRGDAVTVCA